MIRPALLSSFRPKATRRCTSNCEHHSVGMPRLATRIPPLAFRQLFDWISCDPNVSLLAARLRCWQALKAAQLRRERFSLRREATTRNSKTCEFFDSCSLYGDFQRVRARDPDVNLQTWRDSLAETPLPDESTFRPIPGPSASLFLMACCESSEYFTIVGIVYDSAPVVVTFARIQRAVNRLVDRCL